jgi:hypothetical protein
MSAVVFGKSECGTVGGKPAVVEVPLRIFDPVNSFSFPRTRSKVMKTRPFRENLLRMHTVEGAHTQGQTMREEVSASLRRDDRALVEVVGRD